jgi:hypothetical protein
LDFETNYNPTALRSSAAGKNHVFFQTECRLPGAVAATEKQQHHGSLKTTHSQSLFHVGHFLEDARTQHCLSTFGCRFATSAKESGRPPPRFFKQFNVWKKSDCTHVQ